MAGYSGPQETSGFVIGVSRVSRQFFSASILLITLCAGCRSAADFQAASLPDQYRAQLVENIDDVDLTQLASRSIATNTIYPGDVLDVTIASGLETAAPAALPMRVNSAGQVIVPLVGAVNVAGFTLTEAEREIAVQSIHRGIYKNPHVTAVMRERSKINVRVVGAVMNPGVYELPAVGSDVLSAMVAAGGPSELAGSVVEVRHPNGVENAAMNRGTESAVQLASFSVPDRPERLSRIELANIQQASKQELVVEDGTIVMVMPKAPQAITVIGNVRRAGSYEIPPGQQVRVLDAIAMAGDRTISVADKVRVIRRVEEQNDPIVIDVSIRKAKVDGDENLLITPGDIVSVEDTATTMITQTVRSFLRFGFTSAVPGL
ncbi:MAG: polysaccharide biosynthesis/export family protein [Planctomycetales bacterium]|nr:polysaccharide biosynthesis/export family protein [Planctomycetales bacterium]